MSGLKVSVSAVMEVTTRLLHVGSTLNRLLPLVDTASTCSTLPKNVNSTTRMESLEPPVVLPVAPMLVLLASHLVGLLVWPEISD